jgi:hypothetical protein
MDPHHQQTKKLPKTQYDLNDIDMQPCNQVPLVYDQQGKKHKSPIELNTNNFTTLISHEC